MDIISSNSKKVALGLFDFVLLTVNNFKAKFWRYLIIILGITLTTSLVIIVSGFNLIFNEFSDSRIEESIIEYGNFITIICLLLTTVGIISTLFMAISERYEEISLLRVSGAKKHHVILLITFESFIIGIIGITSGLLIGLGFFLINTVFSRNSSFFIEYFKNNSSIIIDFFLERIIYLTFFISVIIFVSSLYPTIKAVKIPIGEGLYYQI